MKNVIKRYVNLIIENKFQRLGRGERNAKSGKSFREIAKVISGIDFKVARDSIVFRELITHYGHLSEIRAERINQSLTRLPLLLKTFLYISSFFTLLVFVTMPFSNMYYGFIVTGIVAFIISMVLRVIEDLDNPFAGFWNLTPEPFERTLQHTEKDY